jgi:1-acyl-sn-glycerol-3-phosphate acyltransferase
MLFFLTPFHFRYWAITRWPAFVIWCLKHICQLDYQVQGREHLPSKATVIASKHQSAWETLAFQNLFVQPTWVLKRELLWIPFFGWGLRLIRPIAINRSSGRRAMQQVIEQGTASLARGQSVIIFPEGTRVNPGQHKRYGLGAATLAIAADVPIVPVAHNAGTFWRRKEFIKRPGTVQVVIGPPIETTGKTPTQITQEVEHWIEATMLTLT